MTAHEIFDKMRKMILDCYELKGQITHRCCELLIENLKLFKLDLKFRNMLLQSNHSFCFVEINRCKVRKLKLIFRGIKYWLFAVRQYVTNAALANIFENYFKLS